MIYLDSSAAVKAILTEPGSDAVRGTLATSGPFVSSRLLAVELMAVLDRRGIGREPADDLLELVALVALTDEIAADAIALRSGLRTLDALHLATALLLGGAVTAFLGFDRELTDAAERAGIPPHPLSTRGEPVRGGETGS